MRSARHIIELIQQLYGATADPALERLSTDALQAMALRLEAALEEEKGKKPAIEEERWEDAVIEGIVPRQASVLDLGCGEGVLLRRLMDKKAVRAQGIELDPDGVAACVKRGVPVIQSNLDEGLRGISDRGFDFVILEETLQTVHRPMDLLQEMLRVGHRGIVSFPNFGHWRVRLDLSARGRMPVTVRLPYQWYNSPNIHLLTIRDFLDWTEHSAVSVVEACVRADGRVRPLEADDNLNAEEALFVVERKPVTA